MRGMKIPTGVRHIKTGYVKMGNSRNMRNNSAFYATYNANNKIDFWGFNNYERMLQ